MSDLRQRTVKGLSWSFFGGGTVQVINFVTGLVLARLLSPGEFGLLGMISIFISISNAFIDCGFTSALIRQRELSEQDCSTAFYFNFLNSLLFYGLLYSCSPLIADFFNRPELLSITRMLGLVLPIGALAAIQQTLLVKQVNFKPLSLLAILSAIVSGIIGISMALAGFGVWSLVAQILVKQALQAFLLWIFNEWRPTLHFSWTSFRGMFRFGYKLLLSNILQTAFQNLNYLVIGRCFSPGDLGQYTRAEQFASLGSSNLCEVIQRVSYPALASLQDEPPRLREAFRKFLSSAALLSFGMMFGLAAMAHNLILILIGEKWLPCVPYLQLLSLSMLLYPFHTLNLNILNVLGRSDLFLKLELIKKLLFLPVFFVGAYWGIIPMLFTIAFASKVCYFVNSYYAKNLIQYSSREQLRDALPFFGVSLVVAFIMWSISFTSLSAFWILSIQAIVGLFGGHFIYSITRNQTYLELLLLMRNAIKAK